MKSESLCLSFNKITFHFMVLQNDILMTTGTHLDHNKQLCHGLLAPLKKGPFLGVFDEFDRIPKWKPLICFVRSLQGADILAPLDTPPYPIAHAHK